MLRLCAWAWRSSHSETPLMSETDEATASISPEATSGGDGQPAPRLVQDEGGHREQERRIGDGRQDLQAQVAERRLVAGRPRADPDRQQGETEPDDIGQDVAGVGEQRQAVGRDARRRAR